MKHTDKLQHPLSHLDLRCHSHRPRWATPLLVLTAFSLGSTLTSLGLIAYLDDIYPSMPWMEKFEALKAEFNDKTIDRPFTSETDDDDLQFPGPE